MICGINWHPDISFCYRKLAHHVSRRCQNPIFYCFHQRQTVSKAMPQFLFLFFTAFKDDTCRNASNVHPDVYQGRTLSVFCDSFTFLLITSCKRFEKLRILLKLGCMFRCTQDRVSMVAIIKLHFKGQVSFFVLDDLSK